MNFNWRLVPVTLTTGNSLGRGAKSSSAVLRCSTLSCVFITGKNFPQKVFKITVAIDLL